MNDTTIVILIDALGFELATRHGFHPSCLPERTRLRSVLGFSQAALTSILTGVPPDRHGLWMMYSFADRSSPFSWLTLVPARVSARRLWFRRLIRWNLTHVHRVKGYYSLYDIPREVLPCLDIPARGDLFAPGGVGGVRTIFDELERRRMRHRVWDYHSDEEEAFRALADEVARGNRGFYVLYTARLDAELHRCGCCDPGIPSRLEWYRAAISRISDAASAGGLESRIFVFGDHGMCDVNSHVNLMGAVASLGLDIPDDYVPFYDSTMARFKIHSERARGELLKVLGRQPSGHTLTSHESEELGVAFADGRFGDIIFLVDPGSIILPSFMGSEPVAAMHGYHPDADCMDSVLFSNVELSREEMAIGDIASLVLPGFEAARGRRP